MYCKWANDAIGGVNTEPTGLVAGGARGDPCVTSAGGTLQQEIEAQARAVKPVSFKPTKVKKETGSAKPTSRKGQTKCPVARTMVIRNLCLWALAHNNVKPRCIPKQVQEIIEPFIPQDLIKYYTEKLPSNNTEGSSKELGGIIRDKIQQLRDNVSFPS